MKSIIAIVCLIGIVSCQTGPSSKPAVASVDTTKQTVQTVQTTSVKKEVKPARKGCYPLCRTPLATCVRLDQCTGNDCFKCAVTASIVLPTTKITTTVEKKRPYIIPGANMVSTGTIPADLQALITAQQLQQIQQTQQTQTGGLRKGGLFGSADPFQNMMFGSMLFDGGMGFF